ncbi:MAG: lipid A biosynthesis acyltransferase [Taibaiella sp.]|nr:lipid A biosynthesis acyltransferase [Taibaiella sp.]
MQKQRSETAQAWQGRSKGSKLGYKIFVSLLQTAGVGAGYLLLRFVALYYLFFSSSTKHIYQYFRKKIGYSRLKAICNTYRNYYIFGQTLIDKVVVMAGMKSPFTYEMEGEHYLEEIAATGRGGILISAHLGNWELAGHFFKRLNIRVNIVMYDREREQLKEYLDDVMQEKRMNIIAIKDDFSHIYEINNALKGNELICLHGDRYVKGSKAISANFLGEEALFPMGPFILAATFKVPVSYVFCFKESKKHYHLFASSPIIYDTPKQQAIREAINDYINELNTKVKRYPLQWFNYYDFWNKS